MNRDEFDRVWAWEMLPTRTRWRARASSAELSESQRTYAGRRAESLARSYFARQDDCEVAGTPVKCGCDGPGTVAPDPAGITPAAFRGKRVRREGVTWHSCRRHLTCDRCRIGRSNREGARIRTSLTNHLGRMPAGHHLVMLTMALRHSGDVRADRMELSASWRRFRDSYADAFRTRVGKRGKRWLYRRATFPFVGVYEVTPGEDGLGHVHIHVLCVWPKGQAGDGGPGDWSVARRLWVEAAQGRSEVIFFSVVRRCGAAAGYVAKYVSKGVGSDGFNSQLSARVCAATYNTRFVFTSRYFWEKWENRCPACQLIRKAITFGWSHVAESPSPPPNCWSTGPPGDGRYHQAIIPLPQPHQCGSASGA